MAITEKSLAYIVKSYRHGSVNFSTKIIHMTCSLRKRMWKSTRFSEASVIDIVLRNHVLHDDVDSSNACGPVSSLYHTLSVG